MNIIYAYYIGGVKYTDKLNIGFKYEILVNKNNYYINISDIPSQFRIDYNSIVNKKQFNNCFELVLERRKRIINEINTEIL